MAREEVIGGQGSDGEMESRAKDVIIARKEEARVPRAPNVSSEKGTRRKVEEEERVEYLEILRDSARVAELSCTDGRER
jgi:hypothetical protein